MTQPKLLELAKQGDIKAIVSVINYLLKSKNITAKAVLRYECLEVMLESDQVPEQISSVDLIRKLMLNLRIASLKSVKIYGKKIGHKSADWIDYIYLTQEVKNAKHNSDVAVAPESKQKKVRKIWPAWLPYPLSWFKALILIPLVMVTLTVSFIFTGFWGITLSAITNRIEILILAIVLGVLAPLFLIAYVHYFFISLFKMQRISNNWPLYLPPINSLWEGFYAEVVLCLSLLFSIIILLPFFPILKCNEQEIVLNSCSLLTQQYLRLYFDKYYLDEIGATIWIITAAYLYQAEYLFRQHYLPKIKSFRSNSSKQRKL
ncbi:hypothetical protein HCG51_09490 [Tolypothrix sp. PCC 7910]|uniref:hypothetical protein n=1 Tax=Tolypothrix sp. PCC 7910 TaxID=2099387 RepID=UPI0014277071|nr:hypothetical protein [Tolypothrix sp. PCC 7910]QIR36946.1 hypothetical protein HCG51_09490 [Tolypothrix sp. PCC 7910]